MIVNKNEVLNKVKLLKLKLKLYLINYLIKKHFIVPTLVVSCCRFHGNKYTLKYLMLTVLNLLFFYWVVLILDIFWGNFTVLSLQI